MGKQPLIYKCDDCGEVRDRDELAAKRVQFKEMGATGKLIKTRVIAWLCNVPGDDGKSCRERDVHWDIPAYTASPGTAAKTFPEDERAEA